MMKGAGLERPGEGEGLDLVPGEGLERTRVWIYFQEKVGRPTRGGVREGP